MDLRWYHSVAPEDILRKENQAYTPHYLDSNSSKLYSYNPDWENIPEFRPWLRKSNAPDRAYCLQCRVDFNVATRGLEDVEQHLSQKHLITFSQTPIPPPKLFKADMPVVFNQMLNGIGSIKDAERITPRIKENQFFNNEKDHLLVKNSNFRETSEEPSEIPGSQIRFRKQNKASSQFPDIIILNVGGYVYQTSLASLTKYPASLLGAMFTGKQPVLKDSLGRYFLDCNGQLFIHILNFLNQEILPPPDNIVSVYKLAIFFGLAAFVEELSFKPQISHMLARESIRRRFTNYEQLKRNIIQTAITNCKPNRCSEINIHIFSTEPPNQDHKCIAGNADIFFGPLESITDTESFLSSLEWDLKEDGFDILERKKQSCIEILNGNLCTKILNIFVFSFK